MAGNIEEQVSALIDGELPHEELEGLLGRLKQDMAVQDCWSHYHLISDALKNNLPDKLPENFVSRVSTALESEPVILVPATARHRSHAFNKPTLGFALAASVAAVVFLGLGWNDQTGMEQAPSLASNMNPAPIVATVSTPPVVSYSKVQGGQWDVEQPAVASKLNDYLLNHDQFSSVAPMRSGMLPQARLAGFDGVGGVQNESINGRER